MSIDRIGFPLPAIVKGYACLTPAEMELAAKDIDPARPRDGPHGRDAAPPPDPAVDPERVRAASDATADRPPVILSYAPGAMRTAGARDAGAVLSIRV